MAEKPVECARCMNEGKCGIKPYPNGFCPHFCLREWQGYENITRKGAIGTKEELHKELFGEA